MGTPFFRPSLIQLERLRAFAPSIHDEHIERCKASLWFYEETLKKYVLERFPVGTRARIGININDVILEWEVVAVLPHNLRLRCMQEPERKPILRTFTQMMVGTLAADGKL